VSREIDVEQVIARERDLRDREADRYDDHLQKDSYTHSVEDACFWAALAVDPDQVVLDAGCGTGRHLPYLLDRAERVIAVDHSERSLAIARARIGPDNDRVQLLQADLRELPLEDRVVDSVMCCEVIQHVPTAEHRVQVLRELGRVLRPGGLLAVSGYRWLGRVKRHRDGFWGDLYRHGFTARELKGLMADAGFENISVGGIAILPGLAERLGVEPARHARLMFTPVGRHLAQYLIARARKL
jgi:SAM-dependent methyltransferase